MGGVEHLSEDLIRLGRNNTQQDVLVYFRDYIGGLFIHPDTFSRSLRGKVQGPCHIPDEIGNLVVDNVCTQCQFGISFGGFFFFFFKFFSIKSQHSAMAEGRIALEAETVGVECFKLTFVI